MATCAERDEVGVIARPAVMNIQVLPAAAAATGSAVAAEDELPVTAKEAVRVPLAAVAGPAQPGYRGCSLPAGTEQGPLQSGRRPWAAARNAMAQGRAPGAIGEAPGGVRGRRIRLQKRIHEGKAGSGEQYTR